MQTIKRTPDNYEYYLCFICAQFYKSEGKISLTDSYT